MTKKTKRALVANVIFMIISYFICTALVNFFNDTISIDWIPIILNIIVIGLFTIINLITTFFFLLYWWSENKWEKCKKWYNNKKLKYNKRKRVY